MRRHCRPHHHHRCPSILQRPVGRHRSRQPCRRHHCLGRAGRFLLRLHRHRADHRHRRPDQRCCPIHRHRCQCLLWHRRGRHRHRSECHLHHGRDPSRRKYRRHRNRSALSSHRAARRHKYPQLRQSIHHHRHLRRHCRRFRHHLCRTILKNHVGRHRLNQPSNHHHHRCRRHRRASRRRDPQVDSKHRVDRSHNLLLSCRPSRRHRHLGRHYCLAHRHLNRPIPMRPEGRRRGCRSSHRRHRRCRVRRKCCRGRCRVVVRSRSCGQNHSPARKCRCVHRCRHQGRHCRRFRPYRCRSTHSHREGNRRLNRYIHRCRHRYRCHHMFRRHRNRQASKSRRIDSYRRDTHPSRSNHHHHRRNRHCRRFRHHRNHCIHSHRSGMHPLRRGSRRHRHQAPRQHVATSSSESDRWHSRDRDRFQPRHPIQSRVAAQVTHSVHRLRCEPRPEGRSDSSEKSLMNQPHCILQSSS